MVSLVFVRSVATAKVVDAIIEALPGESENYKASIRQFKSYLLDGIGSSGVKDNDDIQFAFKGKSESEFGVVVGGIE